MKQFTIAISCLLAALIASSASYAEPAQVSLRLDAVGVKKLIVRSTLATVATRVSSTREPLISIRGRPRGGTKGYHPSDPNWKETKPEDWGLKFVSRTFGDVLVVSSLNEIGYIHHQYLIEEIEI